MQQPTVQESSPSSLPVFLQYYFHFPQPNCPSLLAGKAGRREGKEGRELRNYRANYILMDKKTQRKKILCRFFKPVLSMAPKQDSSLLRNNCQLTLDLQQNVGNVLPTAVNLLSHYVSAMLQDAFSSSSNHSRIPQESAGGVSGLQVPLILFTCSRDLKVPVLYSQQKKECSNIRWRHSRNYCCAEAACGVWLKKN